MASQAITKRVLDAFHHFHQNPELSYQEFKTTERIKQELKNNNITILPYQLETGCVAEIGSGDRCVAIRADIDALPVTEETSLPYKSQVKGVMHACGHDFHTALMLGAAATLKQHEKELLGRVRVVFQPAEEAPGGAKKIIECGALEGVEAIYGVHTIMNYPVGTLCLREGATHAAVDRFAITFKGHGTHAAHPEMGIDTLYIASQFVVAAQSIVSRNSDPFDSNLLSITHLDAGTTWNVIPETVFLEGTIRTMTPKTRELVKTRMLEVAQGIAKTFGATVEIQWIMGLPPMQNDLSLTEFASALAQKDGFKVERPARSLGGEDFALYEELIPGAFIQVGSGDSAPHHNPKFIADERAIMPAAEFVAHVAQEYLASYKRN